MTTILEPKNNHANLFDQSILQNRYRFCTKESADITFELIHQAEQTINRKDAMNKMNKYVKDPLISREIERGLFECSLLHIINKKSDISYVNSVYINKLYNICNNLDETNPNVENKTLLKAILKGKLKPITIAFLSPQQMHPDRWESINKKRANDDEAKYNVDTTDDYECPNCKERKCTVTYIQMRSADEPETKFITCVKCGTTVTH